MKEKGKTKKKGAWAPPLLRVDNGAHMHPQATKHREKRKKMKELDFMLRLGDDTHLLLEATKKKSWASFESW
jgi:hypothetical protein